MTHFDLSIYFPIPLLTTEGYVSMIKTVLMVAPVTPPEHVKVAIARLAKELASAETTLVLRIDEDLSTGLERSFAALVTHVWVEIRERLEFVAIYQHEGTAKFDEEDRNKLDFEERVEESRTATRMLERMFANGTDFLRTPYSQQATHTATRLDWIEAKNLGESFEELVGPKLVTLLKVCQDRYEAMVSERSSRDGKSVADLRELRNHLRRALYAYVGAIGTLYNFDEPESAKLVENALRPILIARENARRKALGLSDEGFEEDEDEDDDDDDKPKVDADAATQTEADTEDESEDESE